MTYYPLTAICLLPIKDKNQVRPAIPAFHKREMSIIGSRNALKADFSCMLRPSIASGAVQGRPDQGCDFNFTWISLAHETMVTTFGHTN
jgi:hypothetical protein